MHIGQMLMVGANVYSPWFPREADNAIFTVEEIQSTDSGNLTVGLTVTIWHKNADEIGEGTEIATTWDPISGTNLSSIDVTGLREMVRFEYTVTGGAAYGQTTVNTFGDPYNLDNAEVGWVIFRMLEPTWYDKA